MEAENCVRVREVVLFEISLSYTKAKITSNRSTIYGILMGKVEQNSLLVLDSFELPFSDSLDIINWEYVQERIKIEKDANKKEITGFQNNDLLGWYVVSPNQPLTHQEKNLFSQFKNKTEKPPLYIHLNSQVKYKAEGKLPLACFMLKGEPGRINMETGENDIYLEICAKVEPEPSEEVSITHLSRNLDNKNKSELVEGASSMRFAIDCLKKKLMQLLVMIKKNEKLAKSPSFRIELQKLIMKYPKSTQHSQSKVEIVTEFMKNNVINMQSLLSNSVDGIREHMLEKYRFSSNLESGGINIEHDGLDYQDIIH